MLKARRKLSRSLVWIGVLPITAVALSVPVDAAAGSPATLPATWSFDEATHAHLVEEGFATVDGPEMRVNGQAVAETAADLRITDYSAIGYNRDQFPHWLDLDGNGFDTRDDVLARDLTGITYTDDGTHVATGTLADPYTGTTVQFQRTNYPNKGDGNSSAVQIDHIVSLAAAWTGGANAWTVEERTTFANDPTNLLAVDGPTNSAKSYYLPSEWMPQNEAYHCMFAAQHTYVLDKYDLAVTEADRDSLVTTATACALEDAPAPEATGSEPSGSTPEAESADRDAGEESPALSPGLTVGLGLLVLVAIITSFLGKKRRPRRR